MNSNKHIQIWRLLIPLPSVFWLITFFLLPLIIIFIYTFFTRGVYGEIEAIFTVDNLKTVFQPIYLQALLRTFMLAFGNVIMAALFGYPMAYYMAFILSPKWKSYCILLIILPFWSSYIARSYSLLLLFSENGPVNHILQYLHLIKSPLQFLLTPGATIAGLLYNYMPFMVISIYIALEKIDRRWLEASRDLGATSASTFLKVVLPLSLSGLLAGTILVLVFSVSDYIIPNLLGGSRNLLISNVITNQYLTSRNVPLGSALAVMFTMSTALLVGCFYRIMKKFDYA